MRVKIKPREVEMRLTEDAELRARVEARFLGRVRKTDSCWLWVGAKRPDGYGQIGIGFGRVLAHRLAYTLANGLIPDGLQIDHLCRKPPCVNPEHLEAVTPKVNTARGISVSTFNRLKTHCPQGHPYDGDNLVFMKGSRCCRLCLREHYTRSNRKRGMKPRETHKRPPAGQCTSGHTMVRMPGGKKYCPTCRHNRYTEKANARRTEST